MSHSLHTLTERENMKRSSTIFQQKLSVRVAKQYDNPNPYRPPPHLIT